MLKGIPAASLSNKETPLWGGCEACQRNEASEGVNSESCVIAQGNVP